MKTLGNSLLFYLRYPAEMNRLYSEKSPNLDGLDDRDRVKEMAREVGEAASDQAATLLEECGEEIERHFRSLGCVELAKIAKSSYMRKNWRWQVEVCAKDAHGGYFLCGVTIYTRTRVLAAWVYRSGAGRIWQQRVLDRLRISLAKSHEDGRDTVELATVPIPEPTSEGGVDREILVAKLMSTFKKLNSQEVHALCLDADGIADSDSAEPGDLQEDG